MNQRYTHRDRKMLDLAHRINECQIQIVGICTGYCPDGCEPAHSNLMEDGHGRGIKSHDCLHAAGCHACHHEIDQGNKLNREEKNFYWTRGYKRTMLEYFKRGWIGVLN